MFSRRTTPTSNILFWDDGSTDDTAVILNSISDARFRWEYHENMGEVLTVNKGYTMAQGEYIAIVNSDDPVLPGFISTTVEFMEARPELLAAYPDWNWIDEQSNVTRHERSLDYSYTEMLRWHISIPASGAVIRRRALAFVPQRDTALRYRADFDYWLQLGLHGPMARIPATLANFRVHADSATIAKRGEQMAGEHFKVIDKVYAQPNLPSDVLAVRNEAYASAHFVAGLVWVNSETPQRATYHFRQVLKCYPPRLMALAPQSIAHHLPLWPAPTPCLDHSATIAPASLNDIPH